MMRRSMRLLEKVKSEEEIEDEIKVELEARMEKHRNTPVAKVETPRRAIEEYSEEGSIGKWLSDKEKRTRFMMTSSMKKSASKLPKPSDAQFVSNRKAVSRKLNLEKVEESGEPVRHSSRSARKRSPQRTKLLPPKSPFKFSVRLASEKFNFQKAEKENKSPFKFGEGLPTPSRSCRKTTFKNVVGNYNSKTCKYEAMSARDRRMAYSRGVAARNLTRREPDRRRDTGRRLDAKQLTKTRRKEPIENKRKGQHMQNRRI